MPPPGGVESGRFRRVFCTFRGRDSLPIGLNGRVYPVSLSVYVCQNFVEVWQ